MKSVSRNAFSSPRRFSMAATIALLLAVGAAASLSAPPKPGTGAKPAVPPAAVRFARDIQPILSDNCFKCHGPDANSRAANLRLDTQAGIRQVFTPRQPGKSRAFLRITEKDPTRRMPPPGSNHTLTKAQIDLLRRWIEQGAMWEKHWAFIAPVRPPIPAVKNNAWVKNPMDRFVLARLEREGLKPSPPASKAALLRRVTIDLTGIPPTPAELNAFVSDTSPNAYEKAVDRLLASPRYGERMAWEWLDAARYADTNGYQEDRERTMWPWRNWVIDALNRNMPFDRFTVEQIAGDLLPGATQSQRIATGFHRNHLLNGEGGRIPEESRIEYVADRADTTATVWLGLTAGCARCHDHKFDPVTQKEYYRLFAYFNNIAESGAVDRGGNANPVLSLPTDEQTAKIAEYQKAVAEADPQVKAAEERLRPGLPEWERQAVAGDVSKLPENIAATLKAEPEKRTEAQKKEIAAFFLSQDPAYAEAKQKRDAAEKALRDTENAVTLAMVMEERKEKPRETFLLVRGAYDKHGEKVTADVPAVLNTLPPDAPGNRLGLARWLVDKKNPLTARVAVNRMWQTLFGMGIVATSEDFGVQGARPSHPELLDWLAVEFRESGWDMKRLVKLLVTSATYRQSSRVTPGLLARDPANRLLARGPRYRWPSFVLRDQALALSGLLVEKVGGPSVKPYQPEGVWEDFSYGKITYKQDHGESLYRRTLYTFWRRSVAPTMLFDTATRQVCTVRQARTNTPLQALTLMNDITFVEASHAFAQRAMKEGGKTPTERIAWAFRAATSRRPTAQEADLLRRGFHRNRAHFSKNPEAARQLLGVGESKPDPKLNASELAAYAGVMSVILNLDEVLSKE